MPKRVIQHLRQDWQRIRTKDTFARNAFTIMGGNSAVVVSQLLLTPLIARIYGPEAYGIYGLYIALVMNITSFTDLGYSIAYVLPKENERFMHLFRFNLTLLGMAVVLTAVVGLFKEELYTAIPSWGPLGDLIHLLPLGVAVYGLAVFFTQWLTRIRAFSTSVYIGSSTTITLRLFNLGYGLWRGATSFGLIIGDVVVNSLAAVAYSIALSKHGLRELFAGWSWARMRELAVEYKRYPLFTFPERWVNQIGMQLPVFLLINDPVIVGQFALSSSLLMIPLRVLGYSFSTVFIQKAAETVNDDPELLGRITKGLYQRLFWVGLVPFTCMMYFSDVVFTFVLGEQWHDAGVITAFLGLFFFFRLTSEPMVTIFYAQRREHALLLFHIVLTSIRLAVMVPMILLGLGSGAVILGFAIVSTIGYMVLGYLLLRAAKQNALFLTVRSLVIILGACGLLTLVRIWTMGDPLPSL